MDKLTEEVARAIWLEASICPNKEATWMTMLDIDREPYVRYATAAIEAMRASSASSEARLREALEWWQQQAKSWFDTREPHARPDWMRLAIDKGEAALSNEGSG